MSHAARLGRWGSSPLTRGTLSQVSCGEAVVRLIPTHAGKTNPSPGAVSRRTAHPRSCGENPIFALILKCGCGSSPLMRGKLSEVQARPLVGRLIPDHTGKTGSRSYRLRPSTVHPRSHGENMVRMHAVRGRTGSSPLIRGKLRAGGELDGPARLIPAHAGKTPP